MDLLKARTEPSFGWLEGVVLGLYSVLVGCITFFHEPWSDEAQAWLIARDSSLADLFLKRLHYEGTPGLWHLLLWILCRLHFSYTAMHWVTAVLGVAAVYVLLRYSPFPPLVRAILPFCFSLVFLTAVIARSYSLAPVLTFAACAVLSGKQRRPVLFAVFVGLLANTSAIAFLLALGMVPLYFVWPGAGTRSATRRGMILAGSSLALLLGIAAYTALPAPDIAFGKAADLVSHPAVAHVLSEITGIPRAAPRIDSPNPIPERKLVDLDGAFLARHSNHPFLAHLLLRLVGCASILLFPVSSFDLLGLIFYAAMLWWLAVRKSIFALLPLIVLAVGGRLLGLGEHQMNIVTAGLIVALWLGWSQAKPISKRPELLFQVVLIAVLVEQAAWTAHAAIYDIRHPFDPSVATARFLLPKADKVRIGNIAFEPVSVLPYTSRNIFFNQETTYWPWRKGFNPDLSIPQTVDEHPEYIVDSEPFTGETLEKNQVMQQMPSGMPYDLYAKAAYLNEHGYHETSRFCGAQPAQFGFYSFTCYVIYQPRSAR